MAQVTTIWIKELIDNFRDRRTLYTALLMPVILMPAILTSEFKLITAQSKSAEAKIAKVAVVNGDRAPTLVDFLKQQKKITIEPIPADIKQAVDAGTVNIVIDVPVDFEANLSHGVPSQVTITQKSSNYDSSTAASKINAALSVFNQTEAAKRLQTAELAPTILTSIIPQPKDLASAQELSGYFLGFLLPMFIVIFAIIGGMYVAIDVSAGEKERKTLEALLVTPVSRMKIVIGKFLAVATMATITIVLSVFSMYAAFKIVPPPNIAGTGQMAVNLTIPTLLLLLLVGVILAIMFAGLLLSVAIFAKSYKEAQNYLSPLYLLAVLPVALTSLVPGFKPTTPYFLLPGINAVYLMKEVLLGNFIMPHMLTTLASLLVFAALGILLATKIYSKEGILFRD